MADIITAQIAAQQAALAALVNSTDALTLVAGRTLDARLQQILGDGLIRVLTAQGPIDLSTSLTLAPGARLRLQVQGTAGQLALSVLDNQGAVATTGSARLVRGSSSPPVNVLPQPGANAPAQSTPAGLQAATIAGGNSAAQASSGVLVDIHPPPQPQTVQNNSAAAAGTQNPLSAALTTATATSLTQQGPLAPLFANLAALLARPKDLPEAVRTAIARAAAAPLSLDDGITPAELVTAIANSGVFLENTLAGHNSSTELANDLKAVLLNLRAILQKFTAAADNAADVPRPDEGKSSFPAPSASDPAHPAGERTAPPRRGELPEALAPGIADLSPEASPKEIASRLLDQTDAALSRIRLSQIASRHNEHAVPVDHGPSVQTSYYVEIPVLLHQQPTTLQVRVEREAQGNAGEGASPLYRLWFAVDSEPAGPVSAVISFQPGNAESAVGATLWAEREETGRALRDGLARLREDLRQAHLPVGEITARLGKLQRPQRTNAHFVDRTT